MFRSFKLSACWLIYAYVCLGCSPSPQNINITVNAVDENKNAVAGVRVYIDNRYMGETEQNGTFTKRLENREIKPIIKKERDPNNEGKYLARSGL